MTSSQPKNSITNRFINLSFLFSKKFIEIHKRAAIDHRTLLTNRLSRTLARTARQSRLFTTTRFLAQAKVDTPVKTASNLAQISGPDSLIGPGAQPGTIPTDLDQATGLERFEILGKMEGVDVFDMEKPIFEGSGTMVDPYLVPTYIGYRYVGCRGKDNQDHKSYWMKVEEGKPGRCWQCGTVYAAKYLGEPGHHHH